MMPRASLTMMMGLVAIFASGLAAMKVASSDSLRVSFVLGVVVLLTVTLGAVSGRGRPWAGFALFGWAYALAALSTPIRDALDPILNVGSASEPLERMSAWLHPMPLHPSPAPPLGLTMQYDIASGRYLKRTGMDSVHPLVPLSSSEQLAYDAWMAECDAFDRWQVAHHCGPRIGHVIAALTFSCFGALVGHLLDNRSPAAGASPGAPTPNLPG